MNNLNIQLHYIQAKILKKLSLNTSSKFNDLLVKGLESEHMNYHLKKLIDYKLVEKKDGEYFLTNQGKEYTNLLDDNVQIVEKQPKTSILINGTRINPKTKEVEHLLCKRLKHPYFGKIGRLTGKVRFGETIIDAAKRELFEETGLEAKNLTIEEIYHKMRYSKDNEYIQDVIFYIVFVTDFSGTLIEKAEQQENFWISTKEAHERKDLDFFDDINVEDRIKPNELKITESVGQADGF